MKKLLALLTAGLCLISLSGCRKSQPPSPAEPDTAATVEPSAVSAAEPGILTKPPTLTVLGGEVFVEALKGGYCWETVNADGTHTATIADSAHPLQCRDIMPVLTLMPSYLSRVSPLTAYLQFETVPDSVSVRCWSEEFWGSYDAEAEELNVETVEVDFEDGSFAVDYWLDLKDSGYIYEVTAEWNRSEQYCGEATYSFYAVLLDMEVQSIKGS